MSRPLATAFKCVVRKAESACGRLLPPDLEAIYRNAFYVGAIEAAALIECGEATPQEIAAECRAEWLGDDKRRPDAG